MNPFPLVRASLARNPLTVLLFIGLIAAAVALGTAISVQERALRQGSARAADAFDLIVAAPGSQTDLLLEAVFLRPGSAGLIPGPAVAAILADPDADFAAPIAFGDSFDGMPVVGSTAEFVAHLSGGLADGRLFAAAEEAVVGALVPYPPGAKLEIRHGHADDVAGGDADAFDDHDHDHADHDHDSHGLVTVTGRMRPTGTPWDRAVIVPVEYVWSAHALGTGHLPGDDRIGAPWADSELPAVPAIVMRPKSVAAAYGLRARYRATETMAFFPAEVLTDLYLLMGQVVKVMSVLVLIAQTLVIFAILAGLLAVLDLQRRRFAVLRALGAPWIYVFLTIWLYVAVMVVTGAVLGFGLGWAGSALASGLISGVTGVAMLATPGLRELGAVMALIGLSLILALIPALRLSRQPPVEALR